MLGRSSLSFVRVLIVFLRMSAASDGLWRPLDIRGEKLTTMSFAIDANGGKLDKKKHRFAYDKNRFDVSTRLTVDTFQDSPSVISHVIRLAFTNSRNDIAKNASVKSQSLSHSLLISLNIVKYAISSPFFFRHIPDVRASPSSPIPSLLLSLLLSPSPSAALSRCRPPNLCERATSRLREERGREREKERRSTRGR